MAANCSSAADCFYLEYNSWFNFEGECADELKSASAFDYWGAEGHAIEGRGIEARGYMLSDGNHALTRGGCKVSGSSTYCTPSSLSAVRAIECEIDAVPLFFKPNIWSYTRQGAILEQQRQGGYSGTSSGSSCANATPRRCARQETAIAERHHNRHSNGVAGGHLGRRRFPDHMTFWTYKGAEFPVPYSSRFFVIKSYSVMDVHASFEHGIWTSTEMGNRRLDRAFRESRGGAFGGAGKVFLFFSVNASGRFCGVCEMVGAVDFTRSSGVWSEQGKWRGVFAVEWMMVADVPNRCLQHLKVAGNEDRPVTCSRDTQEIPFETGVAMLKIVSSRQGQDL